MDNGRTDLSRRNSATTSCGRDPRRSVVAVAPQRSTGYDDAFDTGRHSDTSAGVAEEKKYYDESSQNMVSENMERFAMIHLLGDHPRAM